MIASKSGFADIVRVLLKHKADFTLRNNSRNSATGKSALDLARDGQHYDVVIVILAAFGST